MSDDRTMWNGLRRSPLKRKRQWIRQRSKKRARQDRKLAKVRKALIARSGGFCEAGFSPNCTRVGTDPHHVLPRSRGGKHAESDLLWICRMCHDAIHAHPESARRAGVLR